MDPWFIATEKFSPANAKSWKKYIAWSGLTQLEELVSLDESLCPTVLPDIKDEYWPHIVNENSLIRFFVDLDFLLAQISSIAEKNVLCVFRNPPVQPVAPAGPLNFRFLGYDLLDVECSVSALSNCGGFPDAFSNAELSPLGLLPTLSRAVEVQAKLRKLHPEEHHANCHVWAIFRAATDAERGKM